MNPNAIKYFVGLGASMLLLLSLVFGVVRFLKLLERFVLSLLSVKDEVREG